MITSGRCHGPGCQREARVEYWCGEACQAAWSRQVAGLAVNGDVHLPAVREAMRAELDRVVAETYERARQQIPHTAPGSMVEDIQRAFDLVRDVQPPEPVKLTREQWHSLRSSEPERTEWEPGAIGGLLSGVPVVLVDTVEESTPYLEQYSPPSGLDATYPLVASPSPQVAQSGQDRGWLGRLWDRWRQA